MKTKQYIYTLAAAALATTGCNIDNQTVEDPTPDTRNIKFELNINTPDDAQTRALKEDWVDGDAITVLFDDSGEYYVNLSYDGESWDDNDDFALPDDIESTGDAMALHAGAFSYSATSGFSGIEGDLLYDDTGTYAYNAVTETVTVTLTMNRGFTTAIKMASPAAASADENLKWRMAGPGIWAQTEDTFKPSDMADFSFDAALKSLFSESVALPDPAFTDTEMAVFHLWNSGTESATTTLKVYKDGGDTIWEREYNQSLSIGETIAIEGPTSASDEEAGKWEAAAVSIEFPYCSHTNFYSGDDDIDKFTVGFTTYDPDVYPQTGHQLYIDFVTGKTNASSDQQYVEMPNGTYLINETEEVGTVPLSSVLLMQLEDNNEVDYHDGYEGSILGGSVTVTKDNDQYTIEFTLELDDGETFSGIYTGPLQFENPDYDDGTPDLPETFATPDGPGKVYYKRIKPSDPNDKTVMVTNSNYTESLLGVSYSGEINIPATVTYDGVEYTVKEIGDYAFMGCVELTSITLPEGLNAIGQAAFRSTGLTSVVIPEGITELAANTFGYCESLASVTLPDGLESIGDSALAGTAIESITLPGTLESIGRQALSGCDNLTDIYLEWKTEETIAVTDDAAIMTGERGTITLHVPAGSKAIYQNHEFWSVSPGGFSAIIDPADSNVTYGPGEDDEG
jgi:hypothetical protein